MSSTASAEVNFFPAAVFAYAAAIVSLSPLRFLSRRSTNVRCLTISGGAVAQGADLLLHDAQYFEDEYEARIGWGHSSVADAVAYAGAVEARRLLLFHHEPLHADASLDLLEDRARELAGQNGRGPTLAREGMVVELKPA